jgi:glutamyl-Q tRNA(Asp) synthetase
MNYTGRFAPSPTGPLHIGSLITAVASYLDARHQNGKWLLRIDDIDPLREQPGADRMIIDCLKAHGLIWDKEVIYQSERIDLYRDTLKKLLEKQQAFYCTCSRKALQNSLRYPGTCRHCFEQPAEIHAVRIRVDDKLPILIDRWQGPYPADDSSGGDGDFVIWRKEGYVAYQLAAAIDDDAEYISHVVRGSDLLESTPKQIYLQQQLGLKTPVYGHIPVICNASGQKLSKQTYAKALDNSEALQNLLFALRFLNQPINHSGNISRLLQDAVEHWNPDTIPRQTSIQSNN